jgi:hypothetical protein
LILTVDKLKEKLAFFKSIGYDATTICKKYLSAISLSVDKNLRPTFNYIVQDLELPTKSLNPIYLTASLTRIKENVAVIQSYGRDPKSLSLMEKSFLIRSWKPEEIAGKLNLE